MYGIYLITHCLHVAGLKFQSLGALPLELSLNHWTMLLTPSAYMTLWFMHHKRYESIWEEESEFRDSMSFCFMVPLVAVVYGKRVCVPVSFGFPVRQTWVWILTQSLSSCVTLGKSHNSINNLLAIFYMLALCAKCLAYTVSLN